MSIWIFSFYGWSVEFLLVTVEILHNLEYNGGGFVFFWRHPICVHETTQFSDCLFNYRWNAGIQNEVKTKRGERGKGAVGSFKWMNNTFRFFTILIIETRMTYWRLVYSRFNTRRLPAPVAKAVMIGPSLQNRTMNLEFSPSIHGVNVWKFS